MGPIEGSTNPVGGSPTLMVLATQREEPPGHVLKE